MISQGLPSTYLNPQDSANAGNDTLAGNDTTDAGSSFSSQSQQLPVATAAAETGSNTTLVSSTLAESLTEFAGILGDEGKAEEWVELGSQDEWEGLGGDMYDPFDSYGRPSLVSVAHKICLFVFRK